MMSRRAVAAAEALAAAAVVIGHNIFRIVPNEVVVLVLAGAISCAVRRQSPKAIGYRRPTSWWRTTAVAPAVAAALQAFSIFVVDPLAIRFTGQTTDLSAFEPTDCTLVEMARALGEDIVRLSSPAVLENTYVRRDGTWTILRTRDSRAMA